MWKFWRIYCGLRPHFRRGTCARIVKTYNTHGTRDNLRREVTMQLSATLTCPHCAGTTSEIMPIDACRVVYICPHCAAPLRPLPGDCCVFCSYADTPCPPSQSADPCGS